MTDIERTFIKFYIMIMVIGTAVLSSLAVYSYLRGDHVITVIMPLVMMVVADYVCMVEILDNYDRGVKEAYVDGQCYSPYLDMYKIKRVVEKIEDHMKNVRADVRHMLKQTMNVIEEVNKYLDEAKTLLETMKKGVEEIEDL